MRTFVIAYLSTLVAFLGLDAVWLTRMADVLYRPVMGDMLLGSFRPAPALVFYALYGAGLVYFAVLPGLGAGAATAIVNGALIGLVAYATYDLTNQATLKNWSTALTLADLAWGSFVSAAAAGIGRALTLWVGRLL
jgi:uncharacterized membrane protein